jgi:hypothetical protein
MRMIIKPQNPQTKKKKRLNLSRRCQGRGDEEDD